MDYVEDSASGQQYACPSGNNECLEGSLVPKSTSPFDPVLSSKRHRPQPTEDTESLKAHNFPTPSALIDPTSISSIDSDFADSLELQMSFIRNVFSDKTTDIAIGTRELLILLKIPFESSKTSIRQLIHAMFVYLGLQEYTLPPGYSHMQKILYALHERNKSHKAKISEKQENDGSNILFDSCFITSAAIPHSDPSLIDNDFVTQDLPPIIKTQIALHCLKRILDHASTNRRYNHYDDIRSFILLKFDLTKEKFNKEVAMRLENSNKSCWEALVSQSTNGSSKKTHYNTSIKAFDSFQVQINPFAPIGHLYKSIHYSGLTKFPEIFQNRNKIYYHLCDADPFFYNNLFGFNIQLVCKAEFFETIQKFTSNDSSIDQTDSAADPSPNDFSLTFNPSIEDTMITEPFSVIDHDKIKFFCFNFPQTSLRKVIPIAIVKKLLTPIVVQNETPGVKTLFDEVESPKLKSALQVPLFIPDDIIPFFMNLNTFSPVTFKNLPKDAKLIYTLELSRLGITLHDALANYIPTDATSKRILDVALTQWLVVPTFLLLFPASKHKKLIPRLARLMRQRIDAIRDAVSKGIPHIHVDYDHLFNKPRPVSRVSGKNKTAERKIIEGKYRIAISILKSFDTPFTEPHNSAQVLNCLKKLTPSTTIVNGSVIEGHTDLNEFVRKHELDHDDKSRVSNLFTIDNIRSALQTNARKNTSPGIDRLHAELLHSLIMDSECNASSELLHTLVKLFNRLVISPSYIWKYINISSLHGIPKTDSNYRPIANGTQWRKSFGSIILHHFAAQIRDHYGHVQFAGKRLAAEQITSIARSWLLNKRKYIIKVDIKNAFNTFLRSTALFELIKSVPELGYIAANMFSMPLPLIFQNTATLDAVFGSQQGCIFGGLLFNFAFQKVLTALKLEFPDVITLAYMDDNLSTIDGPVERVVEFILALTRECETIGLQLNLKKSCIIIPEDSISSDSNNINTMHISSKDKLISLLRDKNCEIGSELLIQRTSDENQPIGIEVLGCPIGNDTFILNYLTTFFDDYYDTTQASRKLQSHHCRWSLAKNSIFSKLIYIMRLVPPEFTCKFYKKLEEEDWLIIESIIRLDELHHITPDEVDRIVERGKLKITHGGFNLRDYDTLSKSAFLGSQLAIFHDMITFLRFNDVGIEDNAWLRDLAQRTQNMEKDLCAIFPAVQLHQTESPMLNEVMTHETMIIDTFIKRLDIKANRDTSPTNPRKYQAFLSKHLYQHKFKERFPLIENHSHKWLCIDASIIETPVANPVYTRMFRDGCNIPFVRQDIQRKCVCGKTLDPQEKHLQGCCCFGIKERHNNVVKIIRNYLNSMDAKAITGEIPIDALEPIMHKADLNRVKLLRPDFVNENRMRLDESLAPDNSASSYNQIKKTIESLSHSDTATSLKDNPGVQCDSYSMPVSNDDNSSNSCSTTNYTYPTECPPHNSIHPGSSNSNNNSNSNSNSNSYSNSNLLSSELFNSSASTKGTRIDIVTLASWIRVMMDVTIVNNVQLADHEYIKKFDSAESKKLQLHLQKAHQQGYEYVVPIFSTDGSPSKNTKKTLQGYFRSYLSRLHHDHAKIVESYGNKTDHYLNLICFQIHRDNAEHANRLNLKLHQKKKSSCDPIQTSLVNDQHCTDDNKDAQFIADMRAQYNNKNF